eukprot:TRINITY_DN3815_c0_g7_i1.p1 TRINITY_DN3815_c0_g7~~TRINITY_DN3815_c0_g7_i1.p1  ORF type:complete len:135 (-),score=46.14 TRINITY_DN3815_c0_g7_i1:189-593(-)
MWGGFSKGNGKGFGGSTGGWGGGYAAVWNPMFMKMPMKGKGKGKGSGLGKVDDNLKVWIGQLPAGVNWKALQEHMNQAGKTKWIEVFEGKGKGTGAAVYQTPAEATNAIAMLNGSALNGGNIVVDPWVRAPKTA